jgi:hypothetical protein
MAETIALTFVHIPTALALEERCENVQNAENLVVKIALIFKTVLIASAMYVNLFVGAVVFSATTAGMA